MVKYFDINAQGFYEDYADDRIEVSDEYWQVLLSRQSQGGVIQVVENCLYCLLDNEKVQNGQIVDVSDTTEYKSSILQRQNQSLKVDLQRQIAEFDMKSIRAIREGGIKDSASGQTWLEYYTEQIQSLRAKIADL